jgi:YfiH family protein
MARTDSKTGLIRPDWPAPPQVRAVATTRVGGVSKGPWSSLNLGGHVGDSPEAVAENRRRLADRLALPAGPCWLDQVHGDHVTDARDWHAGLEADGCVTAGAGQVCAVMTADCLPVLLCDRGGRMVAALHAGWRGLVAGILDAGVAAFAKGEVAAGDLLAWLGPAIGADAYEVGDEVRDAFDRPDERAAFVKNARGRWQMDLAGLASARLAALGVTAVYGGGLCTHRHADRFFSHRRDGICGRQAALIWLQPDARKDGPPR